MHAGFEYASVLRLQTSGRTPSPVSSRVNDDSTLLDLQKARAGDAELLGRALESCRDYLLLIAAREIDRDLVAKGGGSDLVQDTLLGAYRDFGTFHGHSRDELLAWLRKILENNLAVFRRRYRGTLKRQVSLEVSFDAGGPAAPGPDWVSDSASPSTAAAQREQAAALESALGRIPEDYRRVIVWYQYDQHTFEEIGRRLDRSPEAARKIWSRALVRLTQELGPTHDPRA
jgi:RNA polymerase sigma-70 factor, ECF subfamily